LKILHIVPSYKPAYVYGGTIESIARLCEALSNAGQDVTVFTTTANGKEELDVIPGKEYNVEGVRVIYFARTFKDPFYISTALWKKLSADYENYDAIHIHSWWNMIVMVAAFICKRKKVKFILSPHGMMSDYILQNSKRFFKWLSYFVFGKSLLKASVFHATSIAEFKECKNLIEGWDGFIIPNIVWLPQIIVSKPSNKDFSIVFLSRIHPKKGIELLMKAISLIHPNPILKIAGTGDDKYLQKLKRKAKNLGIENNIEWLGWQNRDEKFEVLMQADLFALTSYNENFGNVVIESLHAGTPVLVSQQTGLSKFIAEHNYGWVCDTNVNDIHKKIRTAIADKETREKISKCASLNIYKYFSEDKLIPEYLKHYQA